MHPAARRSRVSPVFLFLILLTVGGGLLAAQPGRASLVAGVVLLVLGGWAVSLCLHEFGHAVTAHRGGDPGIAAKGYLTLDIRRYSDIGLSLVLPVVLLLLGGIPLPGGAVWINEWAIRSRVVRSLVSLAGPVVNLVLGVLLVLVVATLPMPYGPTVGLSYLALVQVLAFLLNILPVPGLDGFGVLEPYLPPRARELGAKVRPWAPLAFLVLIVGVDWLGGLFFTGGHLLFTALGGDAGAAAGGYTAFMFWRN